MATKRGKKRKYKRRQLRETARKSPEREKITNPSLKGVVFDLCCGKYTVMKGLAEERGKYRVAMESHGFEVIISLNEEQAAALGTDLTSCVAESRKEVN